MGCPDIFENCYTKYLSNLVDEPCFIWRGSKRNGYGRAWVNGSMAEIHRLAYETNLGPIPPGFVVDHLCRVPACCNPGHLEAVTHAENIRRGNHQYRKLTHCRKGHPLSGDNLYSRKDRPGERGCKKCRTQAARKHQLNTQEVR